MPCNLVERDGKIVCTECGRAGYELHRKQMCGREPKPNVPKCDCGVELKRRKNLAGDGLWWWWCSAEDRFVRECKTCNQR